MSRRWCKAPANAPRTVEFGPSSETASRGGTGVEIDLARVPQRETGMTPYETLLSESQERMLIIVKKGREQTVVDIFEKWDLPYAEVGVVKDDGMMRVRNHGEIVGVATFHFNQKLLDWALSSQCLVELYSEIHACSTSILM